MTEERRSTTSVGARLRGAGDWGTWAGARSDAEPGATPPGAGVPLEPAGALHDVLTGLPNRSLLLDRLDCALKRAARSQQRLAVAVIEVASVPVVVEQHGPGAGDALLTVSSQRLQQALRASDTVARLGAKEFAVVLEGVHTAAVAAQVARKLLAAVTQPCILLAEAEGRPLKLAPQAGAGLALYPDHGRGRDELLAAAVLAMAQARRAGGGVQLYLEGGDDVAAATAAT